MGERFDRWVFGSFVQSPEGLAAFRIVFAAYVYLVVAPLHDVYASFGWIADLPDGLFTPPPGPMSLGRGFPDAAFFRVLETLLVFSLAALATGYRTRAASWTVGLCLALGYGFSYSLGKVNHNVLLVVLAPLMSFTHWGAAWSYDAVQGRAQREVQSWPVSALALLVGFAMFTAGVAKLGGGWLDLETAAAQGHVAKQFVVVGRRDLLAGFAVRTQAPLAWEFLDWATVVFELAFLPAALSERWTRILAALATLFHVGVMLTMNIAFTANVVVYAAFIDWDGVLRRTGPWPVPRWTSSPAA